MAAPRAIALVLTGGQAGVDRAATDVAIELGLPYGGSVPKGGWAEDLPAPPGLLARYPGFAELDRADPAERTRRNVEAAQAVLVLADPAAASPGTDLATDLARARGVPLAVVEVGSPDAAEAVRRFLRALPAACVLHVAGPRASESPGIYGRARALLEACAEELAGPVR